MFFKINLHKLDVNTAKKQLDNLEKVKRERDNSAVTKALADVKRAAENGKGITDAVFEAVKTYASIGEICGELKSVWGEYSSSGLF